MSGSLPPRSGISLADYPIVQKKTRKPRQNVSSGSAASGSKSDASGSKSDGAASEKTATIPSSIEEDTATSQATASSAETKTTLEATAPAPPRPEATATDEKQITNASPGATADKPAATPPPAKATAHESRPTPPTSSCDPEYPPLVPVPKATAATPRSPAPIPSGDPEYPPLVADTPSCSAGVSPSDLPSHAEILKKNLPPERSPRSQRSQEELEKLGADLTNFLNKFVGEEGTNSGGDAGMNGEDQNKKITPYYKIYRKIMVEAKQYTLKVDFLDVLKEEGFMDLAIAIANESNDKPEWLQGVARKFIAEELDENQKKEDQSKFTLRFTNMPLSLNPLTKISRDQLVKRVRIFRGRYNLRVATSRGRHIFLCVLLRMLESHSDGLSWSGELELCDLYILSYPDGSLKCWVTKGAMRKSDYPVYRSFGAERRKDLVQLGAILMPLYKDETQEEECLPLFFSYLSSDLKDITAELAESPLYLLYLEYHPALMPSVALRDLIRNLLNDLRSLKLTFRSKYDKILQMSPFNKNWVHFARGNNDPVIKGVYSHENPAVEHAKNAGDEDTEYLDQIDKYKNTFLSLLIFARNLVEHCYSNLAEENTMEDSDDSELFLSYTGLSLFLPKLLVNMLSVCGMKDEFKKTWSGFKSMRSNTSEPGK